MKYLLSLLTLPERNLPKPFGYVIEAIKKDTTIG